MALSKGRLVVNYRLSRLEVEEYLSLSAIGTRLRSVVFFLNALKRIKKVIKKKSRSTLDDIIIDHYFKNTNDTAIPIMYYIYQIGRNIEWLLWYKPYLFESCNNKIHWEDLIELGYNLKKEMFNVGHIEKWIEIFNKSVNFLIKFEIMSYYICGYFSGEQT